MSRVDTDFDLYRNNLVDGVTLDRFDRHLAQIDKEMKVLKIQIKRVEDFKKYRNEMRGITFFYFRGF